MTASADTFRHKRVAIDFDGTLFEDCPDVERSFRERQPLAPQPGAASATHWLKAQGFELLIFTCRPDYHRQYMEGLLREHGIAHDYILFYTKPRVDLYIDDKGYRFESWETTQRWIAARLHAAGALAVASQQPADAFERHLRAEKWAALEIAAPARLLDVGCGDGDVFTGVDRGGLTIDGVEPDPALRARAAASGVYRTLFDGMEHVRPATYDAVLALGVLEHVADDAAFLDALASARVLCCSVPNAGSFHRRFGRNLGLLAELTELQAHDHAVGHRRYYTFESFRRLIDAFSARHGFSLARYGTCSFKLTGNTEMMAFAARLPALNRTARELDLIGEGREYGAEIYCKLIKTTG
jgi:SAM-dependent methyltransferase